MTPLRGAILSLSLLACVLTPRAAWAAGALTAYASHSVSGRAVTFVSTTGQRLRVTAYGDHVLRVQAAPARQALLPDDHYEMVLRHDWPGTLTVTDEGAAFKLTTGQVSARVGKDPLRVTFLDAAGATRLGETQGGLTTGDRPLRIEVNGQALAQPLAFPATGAWDEWTTVSVNAALNAGSNTIRATAIGSSGANLDWLKVDGTLYEAEDATRAGPSVSNMHAGYSGTGFVNYASASGDYVEWTVTAPASASFAVELRYANATPLTESFAPTPGEHFVGLGHGAFGRVDKLDLAGTVVERRRVTQAPLVVPFYISSRGYGIFVDTAWPTRFAFLPDDYHLEQAGGQLDYFYLEGTPEELLDRYTALTGRPRMPPIAAFGLGVSDKVDLFTLPGTAPWWEDQIERMRTDGFPFDMVIHDNCWRGAKIGPWRWDLARFPDPAGFQTFTRQHHAINMLDFNRGDAPVSDGWQAAFGLPGASDYPDFSSAAVRSWFWQLLWQKSFDPALGFPGDALWLDEFDEDVSLDGPLANGRSWKEMGSYYLLLMAKAVAEGWDSGFGGNKRLFVMTRGMIAGGQRWSTVWSGDIQNTYDEMRQQIRGMLAAGLSGFPFWTHDQGGFKAFPSDAMYRQWGVAMGSLTPIWKPHGFGLRFPWLFSAAAQEDVRAHAQRRLRLLPYIYSYAHQAQRRGIPLARAMMIEYPDEVDAWSADQQYLFGRELLVAPDATDGVGSVELWIPPGTWYDLDSDAVVTGPIKTTRPATLGKIPTLVRAGAILPGAPPMASTAEWDRATLLVDVYAGADGSFELLEDDGVSEAFLQGAVERTELTYQDAALELSVVTTGTYAGAPATRAYELRFHGLGARAAMLVDGQPAAEHASEAAARAAGGVFWDDVRRTLTVYVPARAIGAPLVVRRAPSTTQGDGGIPDAGGDGSEPPGDDRGCSCTLAGSPARGGAPWLLVATLVMAALAYRSRRARAAARR